MPEESKPNRKRGSHDTHTHPLSQNSDLEFPQPELKNLQPKIIPGPKSSKYEFPIRKLKNPPQPKPRPKKKPGPKPENLQKLPRKPRELQKEKKPRVYDKYGPNCTSLGTPRKRAYVPRTRRKGLIHRLKEAENERKRQEYDAAIAKRKEARRARIEAREKREALKRKLAAEVRKIHAKVVPPADIRVNPEGIQVTKAIRREKKSKKLAFLAERRRKRAEARKRIREKKRKEWAEFRRVPPIKVPILPDQLEDTAPGEIVVWSPQEGPQQALIECPIPLIGYGGARGGGKTDGVLGKFGILAETLGKEFNGIFFRQELPQTDDLIERAKAIYQPLGAHYQEQKRQFTFQGGGRLRFRPLANNADAEKYQGQNLSHAAVEEAGNYPTPEPIFKLFGALRGGKDPQIILTFNPGGTGHWWLKERFIKPAPKGWKVLKWPIGNGKEIDYVYIPSRVHDNKILLEKDPGYIDRLHMVGSPELVRAWLEGDFEIHEGSYFPEFSAKHIINPFTVPKHWPKYLGFDWGYRSPFAAVWGAVSSGKMEDGSESPIPKGAIVIYRELWGRQVDNVEQAERIAALSVGEKVHAVADPSIFTTQGGPSINDQFNKVFAKFKHPSFRAADNDRVSGWSQIRQRLQADPPMLYIFSNCPYLIESLPSLQLDPKNHEDADTTGDDHACDALRYLCKERLIESSYRAREERAVEGGLVRLQKYINQVRSIQKRARI